MIGTGTPATLQHLATRMLQAADRLEVYAAEAREVTKLLHELLGKSEEWRRPPRASQIIAEVAERHKMLFKIITNPARRERRVRAARLETIRLLSDAGFSSGDIGKMLGGVDSSTIRYHLGKVRKTA